MAHLQRILVVCTGNVCRSPMAEGFLTVLAEENGLDHVLVESSGTHAPEGSASTHFAIETAAQLGADIKDHRATLLDPYQVETADLILVMEKGHRDFIRSNWPEEASDKIRLIREFEPENPSEEDVPDPIGAPLPIYGHIGRLLKECCEGVIRSLKS